MTRQAAKAFYDVQAGDPATGYITPADAQAALDVVYDDMAASSVPRITGNPNGARTGQPGDEVIQTDATTDVKGWIRWIKATGTGNTGWIAGPEADTGYRNIAYTSGDANWTGGSLIIRRVGNRVQVYANGIKFTTANTKIYTLPTGWKSNYDMVISLLREGANNGAAYPIGINYDAVGSVFWNSTGGNAHAATNTYAGTWTFITPDAWPSSLPGTPA